MLDQNGILNVALLLLIFEVVQLTPLNMNPKANQLIHGWMEMVISSHFLCNDLVHHPIETYIYKWFFGVPGEH